MRDKVSETPSFPPVSALMRHRGDMLLIDSVLDAGEDWIRVRVRPGQSRGFIRENGTVPGWVGLEYMAQALNAFAGLADYRAGQAPPIGFLLGTRRYQCRVTAFAAEQNLTVFARQKYLDEDRLALFECQLLDGEDVLAEAEIKAIQPQNPESIFERA